jgi:hypothetical protein
VNRAWGIASQARFFFVVQTVQLERRPVARLHIAFLGGINQLKP